MKKIFFAFSLLLVFATGFNFASAHAIVTPAQAGIGSFQIFTLGVPAEKSTATIAVRLMLPDGINFVTPNVKAGWKVEVKTQATGKQVKDDDGLMVAEQKPVEIDWTGGQIPSGQRDEFSFQTQVPSAETTLAWKAYQTYADNSVMSWDHDPSALQPKDAQGNPDFTAVGPYSTTKIINDLNPAATPASRQTSAQASAGSGSAGKTSNWALATSLLALIISSAALARKQR